MCTYVPNVTVSPFVFIPDRLPLLRSARKTQGPLEGLGGKVGGRREWVTAGTRVRRLVPRGQEGGERGGDRTEGRLRLGGADVGVKGGVGTWEPG